MATAAGGPSGEGRREQANSVVGVRSTDAAHFLARVPMPTTKGDIDASIPDTPNERLRSLLAEASALCAQTETYVARCTSKPSAAADLLENKTRTADWVGLSERGETMFEFSEVRPLPRAGARAPPPAAAA